MPDSADDRRSVSRGREAFQSSGRGGLGNITRSSQSQPRDDRPDDLSPTRGRELAVRPDRVLSVGRGGAGNIHSPSRGDPPPSIIENAAEVEYQARLIHEHAEATTVHSSGRGGSGNITGSRSRSRGPTMMMHSTGRGGAGNMHESSPIKPEALDEEERRLHAHHDGPHSTGRGGVANITSVHEPDIELVTHHLGELESTGRGGAGNIRTRSASRDPAARAASKEKHGIASIFDKLSHPHQHVRVADEPGAPE